MGRGISYSVARNFAGCGFRVGMVSRDAAALKEFEAEIEGSRGIAADAGNEAELRLAMRDFGDAEVLIYNASAGHSGPVAALDLADAVEDFKVNALGAVVAAQEVVPAMRAAGRGTILLTGGGLAIQPMAQLASLSMGKAAIRSLAFSLAQELEPDGIHVATVTVCGFVQPGTRFDPDKIAQVYQALHEQARDKWEREFVFK
jgi:short-subunit dehydrogenase